MTRSKFLYITSLAFTLISLNFKSYIYAQLPPVVNPDNWTLNESKSDEFNDSVLNQSKWWPLDVCIYSDDSIRHGSNGGEGAFFRSENAYLNNGNLVLKVEYDPDSLNLSYPCIHFHTYPFKSGGVSTTSVNGASDVGVIGNYSYGYYEIRAQLPGYYDSNHRPIGFGFYPVFFIGYQYSVNHCIIKHDEVDILEPDPVQYYDARTNVAGVWDEEGNCTIYKAIQDSGRSATPLFDGFHKFALELLPDKIIFYLDDSAFYSADTLTTPGLAHIINMAPYLTVNITLPMGGYTYDTHPYPDAPFPEYMYIDYFRYYELNPNYSTSNELFQNTPNPFIGSTDIPYTVDDHSSSSFINIYNLLGMQVKSIQLHDKGKSKITLSHTELASGLYLYNLVVDNKIIGTKKLIVL